MKDVSPQLIADITLYPTEQGGRKGPTPPVRAPVHDGRDSGVMADTIPAA